MKKVLLILSITLTFISSSALAMPKYSMYTVYYSDSAKTTVVGWKYNSCFFGGQNGGGTRTAFSDVETFFEHGTCSSIGFDPWGEKNSFFSCNVPIQEIIRYGQQDEENGQTTYFNVVGCLRDSLFN
ncbi:hypothetical protein [Aliikangiella sp. IMCC44359]|uniref:hypothetical protein n=1 Tax=Aliikangiella sp. IMCC44359 TaxID=3459125 RepID=UPI00403AF624